LNGRVTQDQKVAPEELVLAWLIYANHLELAEFLADLPFWPIGLDQKGNWV